MAKIWTENNEYAPVTEISQALWHLKVMRSGIRSCMNNPSVQKQRSDDDKMIERIQEQVLTVAIDFISERLMEDDDEILRIKDSN